MTKTVNKTPPALPDLSGGMNAILQAWGPVGEYMTDATQRTILYWDMLRQRSEQYAGLKNVLADLGVPVLTQLRHNELVDGKALRCR